LVNKVRAYLRATQVIGVVKGYFKAKHVTYAA
jgi:hypothetical protein